MTKKTNPNKHDEEQPKVSVENEEDIPNEPLPGEPSGLDPLQKEEIPDPDVEGVEAPVEEEDLDRDDVLADVRHGLISAEEDKGKRKGFFKSIRERFKKSSETTSESREKVGLEFPISPTPKELKVDKEEIIQKESERISRRQREQIDKFFSELEVLAADVDFDLLDTYVPERKEPRPIDEAEQEVEQVEEPEIETSAEPQVVEDEVPQVQITKELPKKPEKRLEQDVNLREIALQDYDESVIEPASEMKLPVGEAVRTTVREFKPAERILWGFVFLVTLVVMLSAGIYFISSSVPKAPPTATPVPSDIPYPKRVILPGDWRIDLFKGRVVDGTWDPQGAEWLEGTEISRWVALPWSEQIEAVVRTFKRDDPIELVMSNDDILTFHVVSIEEMSFDQLQSLDTRTPSLLLILPQKNNDNGLFWVVKALP